MMKNVTMTLAIMALAAAALPAMGADVYNAQFRGNLYACDLDGSNASQLAVGGDSARYVDVSVTGDYIFTGLGHFGSIRGIYRYDLDGNNRQFYFEDTTITDQGIATSADHLYYLNTGTSGEIRRCGLDGSNDTLIYTMGTGPAVYLGGYSLQVTESAIYWISDNRRVQTCGLDGSGAANVFDAGSSTEMNSMFTDGNFIYYFLESTDNIYRRDMDGSNEITLATGFTGVNSLEVVDGELYWIDASRDVYSMDAAGGTPSVEYNFNTVFGGLTTRGVFIDVVPVPEPTTMGLLAVGGLAILRRRRAKA